MRTDDIQPLSNFRPHLTEHLRRVRETGRPLFLTSNGRTAAVVLSPEKYDELNERLEQAENLRVIDGGLADFANGRTTDAGQAMHRIARHHGIETGR